MDTSTTVTEAAWSLSPVTLRPHTPDELPAFLVWYSDPELARLTRHDQTPLHDAAIRTFFTEIVLPDARRGHAFGIHLTDTDALIGTCSLTDFSLDGRSAILRILLGPHGYWGKGYGTEAIRLLVAYGFDQLGLHEITLGVFADNERALKSYRKVGFRAIATTRFTGLAAPSEVLMKLTREDFRRAVAGPA
jgi:RimJ/RimL family protein N-acetyltransferase